MSSSDPTESGSSVPDTILNYVTLMVGRRLWCFAVRYNSGVSWVAVAHRSPVSPTTWLNRMILHWEGRSLTEKDIRNDDYVISPNEGAASEKVAPKQTCEHSSENNTLNIGSWNIRTMKQIELH